MARDVQILARREVFHRFFRIDQVELRHERFDGSMSPPLTRLVLERGDSVAVLPYDPERRRILLCEQFRAATYENGPGWLLEIPAGMLESGEQVEDCARREVAEETGYSVDSFERIGCVYPSPGGSSERIHILCAEMAIPDDGGRLAGNASEGEDVRVVCMDADQAIASAREGRVNDAKTLIALQWLELRRNRI